MGYPQEGLTIRRIVKESIERAKRWHQGDITQWSTLEWAGAMCGEAGECANAAKKLKRLQGGISSLNEGERHYGDFTAAQEAVIHEAADVLLYLVLVAASAGADGEDFENKVCEVFNRKSKEYGFPERLGM
jgi:NTP pyrophosphatase (non-canonical NTP hydrolase)